MPESKIRVWVQHYQWHGLAGLQPKRSRYSESFKRQVLAHQEREQLSDRQIAAIYDIRNGNQVAVWRRKLRLSDAAEGGMGDDSEMTDTQDQQRQAPAVLDGTAQTMALLQENERLRAEVAYLKKLGALIRARRRAAPRRRASSSD